MTKEEILQKLRFDLELRGRQPLTIDYYISKVRIYQDYFDKPADQMGETEICEYLHYLLTVKKNGQNSVNSYNSTLRFLYGVTLDMPINYEKIPRVKQSRRIPKLFTRDEVHRILDSAGKLNHRSMLMLAYGSGLRVSEIINLKAADIESDKMRILVRHGKGDRDRYAMLPQTTLDTLREYWKKYRPKEWLFEAPQKGGRYAKRTLQDAFKSALKKSGVTTPGSIHRLRACFATHFYEDDHNILALKRLLGHARLDTTVWYTQLADSYVLGLKSPIDSLMEKREGQTVALTDTEVADA
jgi:site-specific recombinase XerD